MESKWEFIAKKLEELGFTWLAAKAKEIETVLKCLYDNTVTENWAEDYDLIAKDYEEITKVFHKLHYLALIARNTKYCIACIRSDCCLVCEFAKITGVCGQKDSLFYRFDNTLLALLDFLTKLKMEVV